MLLTVLTWLQYKEISVLLDGSGEWRGEGREERRAERCFEFSREFSSSLWLD